MKKIIIDFYIKYKLEFTIAIAIGTFFNTLLIMFGIWNGVVQRQSIKESQNEMQFNDSLQSLKIDSANNSLQGVHSLENTIELYKK